MGAGSLLKTKLFIPRVRPGQVERKDLAALLDKGLDYRLTYISSPPGFGKTTILSQWLASKKIKSWLAFHR